MVNQLNRSAQQGLSEAEAAWKSWTSNQNGDYQFTQGGNGNQQTWKPDNTGKGTTGVIFGDPKAGGGNKKIDEHGLANYKNSWWSDVPQAGFEEWAANPEQVSYAWTQEHGLGEGTENLLNKFSDPNMLLWGMGHNTTDTKERLDLTGQMWSSALGLGDGPNTYFDPKKIINTVVNLKSPEAAATGKGKKAGTGSPFDVLAEMLNDPNIQTQVSNTMSFLSASLRGIMNPTVLSAYMNFLDREAKAFTDYKYKNPEKGGNFGKWIGDRYGATGGL